MGFKSNENLVCWYIESKGFKGEYESAGKKFWNSKVEQTQREAEKAKVEL